MSTTRVLFVCMGNICRSPTAEGVMRHLIHEAGLQDEIEVDSAGTGDWHAGDPPGQLMAGDEPHDGGMSMTRSEPKMNPAAAWAMSSVAAIGR